MRQPIIQLAHQRQRGQHPGLILQRYLTRAVTGEKGDPAERRALLDAAIQAGKSEFLRAIYNDAYTRWKTSFPRDDLNPSTELRTGGRLIVGLGSENVLETGIRLHHTYGAPLIPGSALKGLASHYCHEVWGQRLVESSDEHHRLFRRDEDYHRLLFGTTEDGGVITFHDAWITPESLNDGAINDGALRLDVMTPHHPKWQTNDAPPTDFDSPVPVSFLSVAGTFHVRLSWSGPTEIPQEKRQAWTGLAMNLLKMALEEWGIGGKTSSGYGRLVAPPATPASPSGSSSGIVVQPSKTKPLPKTWDTVDAQIVPDTKGQGRLFARHEDSGLVGPIQKPEEVPEQERQPPATLKLIVAMISTDGKQIQFLYPTPANQQRAQQTNQSAARGKSPGKRGKR